MSEKLSKAPGVGAPKVRTEISGDSFLGWLYAGTFALSAGTFPFIAACAPDNGPAGGIGNFSVRTELIGVNIGVLLAVSFGISHGPLVRQFIGNSIEASTNLAIKSSRPLREGMQAKINRLLLVGSKP